MALKYINTSTQLQAPIHTKGQPLDGSDIVETASDLSTLISQGYAYKGKKVYVESEDKTYRYNGTSFVPDVGTTTVLSPYQEWLTLDGNSGKTLDDYYTYLREPALNAANDAIQAATALVNDSLSNLAPAPISFSDTEEECGTYNIAGKVRTLYAKTFTIRNLPKVEGETSGYDIADQPLGFNLYLNVDTIIVSEEIEKATADFFLSLYEVTRVSVNSVGHTIITVRCKENTTIDYIVKLKLVYVKFFGDIIEFNVSVPSTVDTSLVELSFPPLKYDKKLLCSYNQDDCPTNTYSQLYAMINNKMYSPETVSGEKYVHFKAKLPPSSYRSNTLLEYTDGCGVDHRFACSVCVWPNNRIGGNGLYVMGDGVKIEGYAWPYLTWVDLEPVLDFGFSITQHDQAVGTDTIEQIIEGMRLDQLKCLQMIGIAPKIMMRPNGNNDYVTAATQSSHMVTSFSESGTTVNIFPLAMDDLYKKNISRRFLSSDESKIDSEWEYVQQLHDSANPQWYNTAGHSALLARNMMLRVAENYGKGALDDAWWTSVDEYFEYVAMVRSTVAYKSVDGNTIKFKLYIPSEEYFYFKSITALLSGISNLAGVSVTSSNNCHGTSFGIKDGKLMVNLDFNSSLLSRAEKYVKKFETSLDLIDDYPDAQYFVQQLKPGIREPFQTRINALTGDIVISSVTINTGAATTNSLDVIVTPYYTGSPTHYLISESPTFSEATWNVYSGGSLPFTLSNTIGLHTVYLKLKNSLSESVALSDSITFAVAELALTGVSINAGATATTSRSVTLQLIYTGTAPTHYMASESYTFEGASWIPFTSNPSFTLSEGSGLKTVHVKLKNDYYTTGSSSDSINYSIVPLALTGVSINAGASETASTSIVVSILYNGDLPTHYKIGLMSDLSDASWESYLSDTIEYALPEGYGNKTVYVQIKTSAEISSIVSDSITVLEPTAITGVTINSGAESTATGAVTLSITVSGTPPTHYMASESASFSGASWISFVNTPSFALSSGAGLKTVYVKVKNTYFETSVVSDSITREATVVSAIVSFNGSANNTMDHLLLPDGITAYNAFKPSLYSSYGQIKMQSKEAVLLSWGIELDQDLYVANDQTSAAGTTLSNVSSMQPTLSGDTGVYPDSLISKCFVFNSTDFTKKGRLLMSLPVGTYTIKILMSTSPSAAISESNRTASFYRIDVNGVVGTPVICSNVEGFTGVNNVQFNAELSFTVYSESVANVCLYLYSSASAYRPSINLFELIKTA